MDFVEINSIKSGYQKMYLTVNSQNYKAITFYEKNNWTRTGTNAGEEIEMIKQF